MRALAPACLVAAAAAAQVATTIVRVVDAGPQQLLARYMADDAFYYFDIARRFPHLEATPGITTTGFHPLYLAVLVPLFRVVHGMGAVRTALVLLICAHAVAGWMLFRLLRRRWGAWTAAALAVAWIVSAEMRTLVLFGLETGLVEVAVLLVLLACDTRAPATRRRCAAVGAAVGVAFLARNDSVFVCVPVAAAWAWSRRADLAAQRQRSWLLGPGAAAAVAAPWAAVLISHGTVLTDSARALPTLASRQIGTETALHWVLSLVAWDFAQGVSDGPLSGPSPTVTTWAVLVVAVLLAVGHLERRRRGAWDATDIALLVTAPCLFVLYVVRLHGIREWYVVYLAVWLFVAVLPPVVCAAARLVNLDSGVGRLTAGLAAAAATVMAGAAVAAPPFAVNGQEGHKYQAAVEASTLLGPGAHLASYNSGIYQFFLAPRAVDNLDGVVNPAVLPFAARGALCRYITQRGIGWFMDNSLDQLRAQPGVVIGPVVTLVPPGGPDGLPQLLAQVRGC